ncbi:MAG: hypothetical protein J5615_01570 [Fibrobacter sp.]|nr:hypothetical protein [Fibrobacter sp.]
MEAFLSPSPKLRFYGRDGKPLSGGYLFTYDYVTSTPVSTFADADMSTRNPVQIQLDANGEPSNNGQPVSIFLIKNKRYKFAWYDSEGNLIDEVEPVQSPGGYSGSGGVSVYEIAMFDLSQAGTGLYYDIDANLVEGLLPIIYTGSQGRVRYYYYTARDSQAHTMTFTCGYDGIVELLVLHSDGTYEFVPIPGEVSVLKGNCNKTSVTPNDSAPTDFDCYEIEKEGDDIWIGSDKRVHANAGWYHVDMGVYVEPVDRNNPVDGRATIYVGAYVGTTPSSNFNYKDYTSLEMDLSYSHETTPAVGFDIHVENDGDVIHLSVGAPVGDFTAECILDWFNIHRIKCAASGGGGGGGDTPSMPDYIMPLVRDADNKVSNNGRDLVVTGTNAWAEGHANRASGTCSHAEGSYNTAAGENSHVEGNYCFAFGENSHASGNYMYAIGERSFAHGRTQYQGNGRTVVAATLDAENYEFILTLDAITAEWVTRNIGFAVIDNTYAIQAWLPDDEGDPNRICVSQDDLPEGTTAAELVGMRVDLPVAGAFYDDAIALGENAAAPGGAAVAIGKNAVAVADQSLALLGGKTLSSNSIAMGPAAVTDAPNAVAIGLGTKCSRSKGLALGSYNADDEALLVVGCGANDMSRADCFKIDANHHIWVKDSHGTLVDLTAALIAANIL